MYLFFVIWHLKMLCFAILKHFKIAGLFTKKNNENQILHSYNHAPNPMHINNWLIVFNPMLVYIDIFYWSISL